MIIGRWRLRPRWHFRNYSALWFDHARLPEGSVYRAAIGLVQVTVMVDAMSASERQRHEAAAKSLMEMLNG